jgi:hypothetical protein
LACNTPEWTAIMHVYRSMRLICLVRTTETIVQLLLSGRSKVRQQYAKVNQGMIVWQLCKGAATDSACNTLPIVLAEMLCVPQYRPGQVRQVRRTGPHPGIYTRPTQENVPAICCTDQGGLESAEARGPGGSADPEPASPGSPVSRSPRSPLPPPPVLSLR